MKLNRIGVWLLACLAAASTDLAVPSPLSAQEPKPRDTLKGSTDFLWSVSFSPDARTLAAPNPALGRDKDEVGEVD